MTPEKLEGLIAIVIFGGGFIGFLGIMAYLDARKARRKLEHPRNHDEMQNLERHVLADLEYRMYK